MRWLAIVVVALAGCIESNLVLCGNGIACPVGTTCDTANGGCAADGQRAACDGLGDGEVCEYAGTGGTCASGVCLTASCGDGRRSESEQCDASFSELAGDCTEYGFYRTGSVRCTRSCTVDVSQCSEFCGDAILNGNELCEPTLPPVNSCIDYGFDRGILGCNFCAPSFVDCRLVGWRGRAITNPVGALDTDGTTFYAAVDSLYDPPTNVEVYRNGIWEGLGAAPALPDEVGFREANALDAVSPTEIWMAGRRFIGVGVTEGFLVRYDGTSWTNVRTFPVDATAVLATQGNVFVIAGTILYRFDGTTWTETPVGGTEPPVIRGRSPTDVWIANGTLLHGGITGTFTPVAVPSGVAVGLDLFGTDDLAVMTYDAGASAVALQRRIAGVWTSHPFTALAAPESATVAARSATDVFVEVLGRDIDNSIITAIAHFDGAQWAILADTDRGISSRVGIVASPDEVVVARSALARSYHYTDSTWLTQPPPPTQLHGAWGTRSDAVYATAYTNSTVHEFDGTTWSPTNAVGDVDGVGTAIYAFDPSPKRLWSLGSNGAWTNTLLPAGPSYGRPFAVAGANDIYVSTFSTTKSYKHWNGSTLVSTNIPDTVNLRAMDCEPSVGCVGVGNAGAVWQTTTGPSGWGPVSVGVTATLYEVLVRPDIIVVGGENGTLAWFSTGTWHTVEVGAGDIVALSGEAADDLFALLYEPGEDHALFHFDGATWSQVRTPNGGLGSDASLLWASRRRTLLGGGSSSNQYLDELVRTSPW